MRQWWARAVALGCMAVASFARHSRSANLRHREEAALRPPLAGGPLLSCREVAACSCSHLNLSQLPLCLRKSCLLRIVVPTTASLSQKRDSLRIIVPCPAAIVMQRTLLLWLPTCPPSVCSSRSICTAAAHSAASQRARSCRLVRSFCGSRPCGCSGEVSLVYKLPFSKKTPLASAPRAYLRFVLSNRGARVVSPLAAAPPSICGAASGSQSFGARAWLRGCRAAPPFRVWVCYGLPLCLRFASGWARAAPRSERRPSSHYRASRSTVVKGHDQLR